MFRIFLSLYLSFFVYATSAFAEFDPVKFKAYLERMELENKPATLIVGCGHACTHHDHGDHWTVDIDDFDKAAELARVTPDKMSTWGTPGDKKHATTIGADDVLDITVPRTTSRYKEKFDVVVFEHVNSVVSHYPISVANAVYMLKEGGKLFLEVRRMHYFDRFYQDIDLDIDPSIYPDDFDYYNNSMEGTLTYAESGIKGIEEDIKLAEEPVKQALIDFKAHVDAFGKLYKIDRKKNNNITYLVRCLNALGLLNIITLIENSTYESPFSKQNTPVIYAEKKQQIDGRTFAKLYKIFNTHKASQWTNPALLKVQN